MASSFIKIIFLLKAIMIRRYGFRRFLLPPKQHLLLFVVVVFISFGPQLNASVIKPENLEPEKLEVDHLAPETLKPETLAPEKLTLENAKPPISLKEQRRLFEDGLSLAKKGKVRRLKQIVHKLANYPLVDYLNETLIRYHPGKLSAETIALFIEDHKEYPFYSSLRQKWLKHLAKQKQWTTFEQYFKKTDQLVLQCLYLKHQQNSDAWNEQVKQIWLTPKSLPKSCDSILTQWKNNNQLSVDLVWQRLNLAAEAGEFRFARYLKKMLPKAQQKMASQLIRYWKVPSRYPDAIKKLYDNQYINSGNLEILINNFIWANPELALKHWDSYAIWSPDSISTWGRSMALSLATSKHPDANTWLGYLPETIQDQTTRHWRLTTLLSIGDWHTVEELLEGYIQLWPENWGYQFWLSQAYLQLNKKPLADKILYFLANKRHYYGFLAAKQLDKMPQLNHQESKIDQKLILEFKQRARFKRAKEFFLLGRRVDARREWRELIQQLTESEIIVAARVAHELGWNDRAIMMLVDSEHSNEIQLRFPMPFFEEFQNSARQFDIPLSFAFAIARQESAFQVDAYSGKGARGLMQLKPSTARSFSQQLKLNYRGKDSLFKPEVNLLIGSAYLRKLYRSNQQNFIFASAAYNAGEKALRKWVKNSKDLSPDIWIELIPYAETRNYVKQVFSFELIYNQLLNKKLTAVPGIAQLSESAIELLPSELTFEMTADSLQSPKLTNCFLDNLELHHPTDYRMLETDKQKIAALCL